MKDLLFHFGITLGKRYTKKQKAWFLEEAAKEAVSQGWKTELLKHKTKLGQSFHLSIGNVRSAQWVLIAAYDTPSKLLLPKTLYYPFRPERNLKTDAQNLIASVLISFGLLTAIYFLLSIAFTQAPAIRFGIWIGSFMAFLFLFKLFSGFANRFNHNRNSASIALALDLLKEPSLKNKLAVIFVDKSVVGIEGLKELRDMDLIQQSATTLILDCLASSPSLVLACAQNQEKQAQALADAIKTEVFVRLFSEESSLSHAFSMFPQGMMMVAGERLDKDLIVRHTRTKKDYDVNIERLADIRNGLLTVIRGTKP